MNEEAGLRLVEEIHHEVEVHGLGTKVADACLRSIALSAQAGIQEIMKENPEFEVLDESTILQMQVAMTKILLKLHSQSNHCLGNELERALGIVVSGAANFFNSYQAAVS